MNLKMKHNSLCALLSTLLLASSARAGTPTTSPNKTLASTVSPAEEVPVMVDLRPDFVPEYLSRSKNKSRYFIKASEEKLNSYGLFYNFDLSNLELYNSLSLRQHEFVNIETKDIIRKGYTTLKNLNELVLLQQKDDLSPEETKKKKNLERRISLVKGIQEKLAAEKVFSGTAEGIASSEFSSAVKAYQKKHHLASSGKVEEKTLRELNKPYERLAEEEFVRFKEFFADRLFHATYVLNDKELSSLVDEALADMGASTPQTLPAAMKKHSADLSHIELSLKIPAHYRVKEMSLEGEIERRKNHQQRGILRLYQIYEKEDNKEERILILETPMALGGKQTDHSSGEEKDFPTPSGIFYLRRVIVMPLWNPPSWAEETKDDPSTKPGPLNAYGMYMAEYYRGIVQVGYGFSYGGDAGVRIHSTNSPNSIRWGGASHGCTRMHPIRANRFFPFLLHYIPHLEMKESPARGEVVPFEKGKYVKIEIR